MTEYIVQDTSLTAVANKIREKTGGVAPLEFPDDFITAIDSIGFAFPDTPEDSILFYSLFPFALETKNHSKNWTSILEYSVDNSTWIEWNGSDVLYPLLTNSFYLLYIRGSNNIRISGDGGSASDKGWNTIGSGIRCVGNLATVLDYQNPPASAGDYCFKYLFSYCANLDFDLTIPNAGGINCYRGAFKGCASMTKAPALPSTTLYSSCYYEMFADCTNLTEAPALPAETLASECYYSMFSGCSALKTAPELPAMQMQSKCYQSMFFRSGLTAAPELPATVMASNCYNGMFSYCFSLSQITALPALTLATSCYENMFSQCKLITQLPELPATTLSNYCYRNMFTGCTGIKLSMTQVDDYQTQYRIPLIGTGTTATSALSDFCLNTGGTFTGTPTINTTYYTSNTIVPAA